MTDRDEMIERAKTWWDRQPADDKIRARHLADFALAEIARAEADLRAKLVAEIKAVKAKCPWTDGEIAYDRAIEIVRGEGGE